MPIASTGDGLSLGVSLVLLEIPDDSWVRQSIVTALDMLTIEGNWRAMGSNSPELSARIFSLILQTLLFDYEPPPMTEVGTIQMWLTDTIPVGWVVLNGQLLSRTGYADLFAVWGTTFGAGDGSTTFKTPDMRSLAPKGAGGIIGIGETAGASSYWLTEGQLPPHNHAVNDPGHTHGVERATNTAGGATPRHTMPNNTLDSTRQTASATTGITTQNTGLGEALNIQLPSMGVHYIAYAGV